jgi:hypothetical protein
MFAGRKCTNFIVKNPLSETTAFVQSSLFNDAVHKINQTIYMKLQQVKIEWGVSGEGGGERKI